MNNRKPSKKLVRKSGVYYTETVIEKELFLPHQEFSFQSYTLQETPSGPCRLNTSKLTVCKNGNGLMFKTEKFGHKRVMTQYHSLGLDEIEILMEYLSGIKSTLKNYAGKVIENTTS